MDGGIAYDLSMMVPVSDDDNDNNNNSSSDAEHLSFAWAACVAAVGRREPNNLPTTGLYKCRTIFFNETIKRNVYMQEIIRTIRVISGTTAVISITEKAV